MSIASRSARLAGAGSALLAVVLAAWGAFSFIGFSRTIRAKDDVLEKQARAVSDVERLRALLEREATRARTYLLTGYEPFLAEHDQAKASVDRALADLRARMELADEQAQLARISAATRDLREVYDRAVAVRRQGGAAGERVGKLYEAEVRTRRDAQDSATGTLAFTERRLLLDAQNASTRLAQKATAALAWAAAAALLLALILGVFLARAFRRIRAHETRLEAVNNDLDAFAGRVAHDLRNVISTLPLIAAIAREKGETVLSARVDKVVRRAGAILDGLLAFSRAGKPVDENARADVRAVAAEVLEDLTPASQQNDVTVQLDAAQVGVACAPQLLHLVLLNLAGNSIKFLAGRDVRRVRIGAREQDGLAVIEVEDSGPGIPPQSLPRIFEPFYRAPGAAAEGTGLGLATVHRIVSAYGGTVSVESQPQKGTTVRVRLPLAQFEQVSEPPLVPPLARAGAQPPPAFR